MADAVHADAGLAPLEAADAVLVRFAHDLTRNPENRSRSRIDALRAAGFPDEAIVAATHIVAYFNFVNRLASGLGVDLEHQPG